MWISYQMDIQWNEAAERCWNFELWLYEQPAVARCCLSLKDRFDVDVVLLLLTAWLGTRGYILQQVDVREAMAKTALWRSAIVKRVRRARLESKRLSYSGGFEVSRFRERLKLSELEAERVELSLLADCI